MQRAISTECVGVRATRKKVWVQTQAFLWIVLAFLVGFYGNGKHDVITVARHHPGVWRYVQLR